MTRQTIDGGRWFDLDAAQYWAEDTEWDGSNHISKATGSQWEHEALYRTAGGVWVLREWSQWQGSRETWLFVTPETAGAWLIAQGHWDAVPAGVLAAAEI